MGVVGNLRDSPVGDILLRLQRERRSGVLRLRHNNGPEGAARIDLVLREGKLVGAARYKSGGVLGTGDALVEDALAAPEDAASAQEYAAVSCNHPVGALAEGASRAGVSYERVVQTLASHIERILNEARAWTAGAGEFVLDGFPDDEVDPESAAARAFLLDDGIPPSRLVGVADPGDFEPTDPGLEETETATSESGFPHPGDLEATTTPQFAAPPQSVPKLMEDDWFAEEATPTPPPEPIRESDDDRRERIRRVGAAAREARRKKREEREARKREQSQDSPFASAAEEPSDETRISSPIAAAVREKTTQIQAATPDEGDDEPDDDGPDDDGPDDDVPDNGVDYSTPGFGEAALMEAEQLLDSEVLGVMLEMGTSAAATAKSIAESTPATTGHVLLVDDEGQLLPLLVPAMREAGLVVHTVTGLSAALERMSEVSREGHRLLVVADLLIKRGDAGGMLGGIDVASHARGLAPSLPVILMAETMSDDVRARASEQSVKALLERPLRAELKKDEAARESFLVALLEAIEEHRPRAEWTAAAAAADTPWNHVPEEGWDVAAIEEKAREVEDIPGLDPEDRGARLEALWRESMHALSGPLSQPEILLVLLRFAAEVFQRAVLFTPVGVELVGFGQFGVELAPGVDPDQAVREIRMPPDGHPGIHASVVQRIAQRMRPGDSTWEEYLTRALGGIGPDEAFFGPVYCQGRLAAVLYGDSLGTEGSLPETTNLEVVLGQAGLALDRSVLEARLKALEGKD